MSTTRIYSPVVSGSGVAIVHGLLQERLHGYKLRTLSPYWGLSPPACRLAIPIAAPITHSHPELGPWIAHRDSTLVTTFHNYYLDDEIARYSSFAQRTFYRGVVAPAVGAALKRARWVTAVSHFTAGLVQKHHRPGKKLVVIRNGVDTSLFCPGPAQTCDSVRVLFVGNPTRRKGVEQLAALANSLPDDVTVACTRGVRDSAVMAVGKLQKLIEIPRTPYEQMPDVYRDAEILLFPSVREGFGLAVAEAMACGLPVITTRASSMPELIDHEKGGYLIEPGDQVKMRDYVLRLAANPQLRAEMGAYNRAKCIEQFSIRRMADEYRQLFGAAGVSLQTEHTAT